MLYSSYLGNNMHSPSEAEGLIIINKGFNLLGLETRH